MNVHTGNGTCACTTSGLGQSHPIVTSTMLARPRDSVLAAQDENERQRLLVFNPSPEDDSLSEHLVRALRKGQDPAAVIAEALPLVRRLLESNERERDHQRDATGPLEAMTTLLHAKGFRSSLTIKDAARQLRPALRLIRDELRKGPDQARDGVGYFRAGCRVQDVTFQLEAETLRGNSLRNQLQRDNHRGTGLHDVLLYLLGEHDELPGLLTADGAASGV